MIRAIELRQAGGSVSIIIPKDMLERRQLAVGDTVFVQDTPQGILLTPHDPELAEGLAAYAEIARENRDALAALAKL